MHVVLIVSCRSRMPFLRCILCILLCNAICSLGAENEQTEVPEGYKSVKLKCGSNSMQVHLETEDDFAGVIYTKGSFHTKQSPCFLDPGYRRGQRLFTLHFPLNNCKTQQNGEVYRNVLVVQNDKDLIMPGDAAFNLECDFSQPRNITIKADLDKSATVKSKVSLGNPNQLGDARKRRGNVRNTTINLGKLY